MPQNYPRKAHYMPTQMINLCEGITTVGSQSWKLRRSTSHQNAMSDHQRLFKTPENTPKSTLRMSTFPASGHGLSRLAGVDFLRCTHTEDVDLRRLTSSALMVWRVDWDGSV
ncbi:cytochrome P450 [Striga asiatica]|uniref:Cytochrome P450 n=1 Tax=Striga asiatica TaxID=4170 RepID=A0A5A7PHU6_STRAF|nr:cytochrome P450 [Striga asiatica]